jgi:hypothetical protein
MPYIVKMKLLPLAGGGAQVREMAAVETPKATSAAHP